jgi:uncharacterized protein YyaL (SSP411 family)
LTGTLSGLALLAAGLLAAAPAPAANALAGHPSPYLAMHGEDPVDWRPWGQAALAEARETNRPILVSSGYFACHWCHVMQRESYRDPDIAALLNRHFVPVKLDRELHPALDAYLIDFVERTAGQAGWPLNVLLSAEGYPMLGFTYVPRAELRTLLERAHRAWERQAPRLTKLARQAAEERAAEAQDAADTAGVGMDPGELAHRLKDRALRLGDALSGGFGSQSRFPMAPKVGALLHLQTRAPDAALTDLLTTTLDAMMRLGLRDHLGGGFFRYTVDPHWETPHFEKMLYDQALLAPLFLHAARVLDRPDYRAVARETLDFMVRELQGGGGGLIASLSALDGNGVEGGYYLWRPEELERLLTPDQRRLLALTWRLEGASDHAAGLLPMLGESLEGTADRLGMPIESAKAVFEDARERLAEAREARVPPRDDKRLAGWNGLALSALAAGVDAFADAGHRRAGGALRDFLIHRLWDGERLHRALSSRGWIGEATLGDYAFVARGLRDWGTVAGSDQDLRLSRRLVALAWERFYGDGGWRLAEAPLLPLVPPEPAVADSPLPSPAAVLIRLTLEGGDAAVKDLALDALARSAATVAANPFAFADHALLLIDPRLHRASGRGAPTGPSGG